MTRIMSIMTGKGGDGKTTSNLHFGIKAAKEGNRVAFVDFDNTPSLSRLLLGINFEDASTAATADQFIKGFTSNGLVTSRDLLLGDVEGKRVFDLGMGDIDGDVFLIPSMSGFNKPDDDSDFSEDSVIRGLRKSLYHIIKENKLDYIFIDNAPEWSERQKATLWCASDVVFVTQPEELSVGGLNDLVDHFDEVEAERLQLNESINLLGILVNNCDNRIAAHKTQMGILMKSEGFSDQLFNTVITTRDAFKNFVTFKCFAWDFKKSGGPAATEDINNVWLEMKSRMESYEAVDEPPLPIEMIEEQIRAARRKGLSYE